MKDLEEQHPNFSCTTRVTYAHCTLGNHVYYGRYLDIFEVARAEYFRRAGMPLLALQEQDTVFQVTECSLKYLRPARYDDELEIRIQAREVRKVRFRLDYEIYKGKELLVTGWTLMVCVSRDERPKRIPEAVMTLLIQTDEST